MLTDAERIAELESVNNATPYRFDRSFWLKQVKDIFFFALASIAQTYITCPRCGTFWRFFQVSIFTFLMWVVLWKGNSIISTYLTTRIPWLQFPLRRLIIGVVTTVSYTLLSILGLMTFFELVFDYNFGGGYRYTLIFAVLITIVISLILHSRQFMLNWRKAELERAKFVKESTEARYENLKSQVNPHFLFNSLNALTNLVYEDQDKAVKFIKQLSEVYRYVLDTREREVVSLRDELTFLKSYLYLQEIRFGDKLRIHNNLNATDGQVAPLALQMLIENAIKHNVISRDEPLDVFLFEEDGFLVVKNRIQKKQMSGEPSSGLGLENISRRYEFLTNQKVSWREENGSFIVRIPILKNE